MSGEARELAVSHHRARLELEVAIVIGKGWERGCLQSSPPWKRLGLRVVVVVVGQDCQAGGHRGVEKNK